MLANEARLLGLLNEARQHAEEALTLALDPFERMHANAHPVVARR